MSTTVSENQTRRSIFIPSNKKPKMATDDQKRTMSNQASEVVVVMVPFVAHGHLNQFANLSRVISGYNIPVHFLNTSTHIRQIAPVTRQLHPSSTSTNSQHRPSLHHPRTLQTGSLPTYNQLLNQLSIFVTRSLSSYVRSLQPVQE